MDALNVNTFCSEFKGMVELLLYKFCNTAVDMIGSRKFPRNSSFLEIVYIAM